MRPDDNKKTVAIN